VAVSTDANTVRDLTQDELAFRPRPGEIITIGQVPRQGAPLVLLRLPSGEGFRPAIDPPGVKTEIVDGKLLITEALSVTPRERADELRGAVAVTWPVDLAPVVAKLDEQGRGARLEVGDQSIVLGALGATLPSGAATVVTALGGDARGARLVTARPKAPVANRALQGAALVFLVASLAGAALLLRRRDPDAPVADAAAAAPVAAPPGTTGSMRASGVLATTGQKIGRYAILRELGAGGMATVYLARATGEAGFEKLVALKVMLPELACNQIIVEHFLDEARLASRLDHPNVVQITDLGRADDQYFIAMEYIDGRDLAALAESCRKRNAPVPPRVGVAILRKICAGLHAAHTATAADGRLLELVHRDVKAANVFVARNGAVKVGDFGIAKANQPSAMKKTEVGQVKGTPSYMAPEHRLGQAVDRRADVYGVGAIAYELLSGIEINLDLAVLAQFGTEGWPHLAPPSQLRPDLPRELDAVIWKALAYERTARYPDCAALEEALEAIANQLGSPPSEKVIAQWVEEEIVASGGARRPTVERGAS
jgi:hypothetical protein